MKSVIKRTLLVIIAVPIFGLITLFFTFWNHLLLNMIMIAASVVSTIEASHFFREKKLCGRLVLVPIIAGVLPLLSYLEALNLAPNYSVFAAFMGGSILIFSKELIFASTARFEETLPRVASNLALLVYPGLFFSYFVRITGLPGAEFHLLLFFLLIFSNDAMAYVFGMLFGKMGKKRRVITPASPNKTLVGFIAGFLFSIISAFLLKRLVPEHYPLSYPVMIFIGAVIGLSCITGDLIESVLKRSVQVKDSGTMIPGRGGVLDSLDSILFSAPVFFYLLTIFAS